MNTRDTSIPQLIVCALVIAGFLAPFAIAAVVVH